MQVPECLVRPRASCIGELLSSQRHQRRLAHSWAISGEKPVLEGTGPGAKRDKDDERGTEMKNSIYIVRYMPRAAPPIY